MDPVLFLAAVALKASALLAVAALAAWTLARASAALRHSVWTLAVLALLALPVLQAFAPRLEILALGTASERTLASFGVEPDAAAPAAGAGLVAPKGAKAPSAADGVATPPPPRVPAASEVRRGTVPRVNVAGVLLAIWALGAIAVFAFFAAGRRAVARLARASRPFEDDAWRALALEVAAKLGIRRPFRMLVTERTVAPMTWGTLRPVLLLPASAMSWSPEQRRAFLVHELAHVARFDCAIQQAAQIACALYWFHPGAWFAARRLRVEREQACDDRVLDDGASASAYAAQLLDAVREGRGMRGAIAVSSAAMAAPSRLKDRVRALLDARVDRRAPTRRIALASSGAALALVSFVAVLAPKPPVAVAETAPITAAPAGPSALVGAPVKTGAPEQAGAPVQAAIAATPGDPLAERFERAIREGREAHGNRAFWVAYAISPGKTLQGGESLVTDSDGWNPKDLSRSGKSLANRFELAPDDAVFLFRFPGDAASAKAPGFDRFAIRSARLAPDLGELPVVSLGKADTDESLSMLDRVLARTGADELARVVVTAISLHDTPRTLVSLQSILNGERGEVVRAQSAEGLARHPTQRSIDVLVEHTRYDASKIVRSESAEALGDLDLPQATEELIDLAFAIEDESVRMEVVESLGGKDPGRVVATLILVARNDTSETVRREAVETLGDLDGEEGRQALKHLASRSSDPKVRAEAIETLEELGQRRQPGER